MSVHFICATLEHPYCHCHDGANATVYGQFLQLLHQRTMTMPLHPSIHPSLTDSLTLSGVHPVLPVLERQLATLPKHSIPMKNPGHLGSYAQASLHVVPLASVLQTVTNLIHAPALTPVMSLYGWVVREMEQQIRQLPIHRVKHDPLRSFHAAATLVWEEEHVELEQVLQVVRTFGDRLLHIEQMTLQAIAHLIWLKSSWLYQAGVESYGVRGTIPDCFPDQLPLVGRDDEVKRARRICEETMTGLRHDRILNGFTEGAIALLAWVLMSLPTDWWLKHEHCAGRSVLLLLNETLDEVVVKHVLNWEC